MHGSDHEVVVYYLELYEEGEVKHINSPTHLEWEATQRPKCGFNFGFIWTVFGKSCKHSCSKKKTGQTLLICSTSPSPYNSNSMQPLHGLSHL